MASSLEEDAKEWRYYRERRRWAAYNRLASRPNRYGSLLKEVAEGIYTYLEGEQDEADEERKMEMYLSRQESEGPRCKCGSFDLNPIDATCRVCGETYREKSKFLKRHRGRRVNH